MKRVTSLVCKECKRRYELTAAHVCEFCFGPLEVEYDYEAVKAELDTNWARKPFSMWRYKELLPLFDPSPVDLGAGWTPLVKAERLAAELGLKELYIKDDTRNPTGSFKDRVVSVAITKARELGFKVAACASTGNLANAVAAHAAYAGMEAYVFVPADLEKAKIVTTAVYGAKVVAVEGNYDDVNRLCAELTSERPSWAFVNVNVRPYYAEGSKTLAFETVEQLGWRYPDHVVVPVASGSQLTKIHKGLKELYLSGLMPEEPEVRISGAQALGCSPVYQAFKDGVDWVKPVKPSTIAKSLAIGDPADGYYALSTVRQTGGAFEAASDEEVIEAIKLLARTEGIFAETAGGVTIACLLKLVDSGIIKRDETVVAMVTGNGFKTVEAMEGSVRPTFIIPPKLEVFLSQLGDYEG